MEVLVMITILIVVAAGLKSNGGHYDINKYVKDSGWLEGNPNNMFNALVDKHGYSQSEAIRIMTHSYGVIFKDSIYK